MATKKKARDLGTAVGVKAARKKKAKNTAEKLADDLGEVMKQTAKEDALEIKLGEGAKHIKDCHGLVQEANARLVSCRKASSPTTAIVNDLQRIRDLTEEIHGEANNALEALAR